MRKQIALILAVAVMLCMPVRAAAESTTITTVVPEPTYQLTIPADIQRNTERAAVPSACRPLLSPPVSEKKPI